MAKMKADREDSRKDGALVQLRAYLAKEDLPPGSRLPPERELSEILGVTRGDLRKAISVLESEGQLWRHVGKGTFLGPKPIDTVVNLQGVDQRTNPAEVMRTRILMETAIAREAALNANRADIEAMQRCLKASRAAKTWRQYETSDNQLHQLIAEATHNSLLIALYDALNAVRRTIVWGRMRSSQGGPPADHHSFAEHEALVTAISERDIHGAERAMQKHLSVVEQRLLSPFRNEDGDERSATESQKKA
ncbi:FadR/GntR family transcriptional regulator [Oxalobacteraceae bacterium R-40]|uniref:FadR/GntR family transcriptional regulator n=1 Tax=Keguizhuia sedimenti TaxID=3064264 RepID=A0ABU1BJA0_9BURK|nr:FadR/GntR family transcriptional regulator [Oxalobacteraceae bacterium R-40]